MKLRDLYKSFEDMSNSERIDFVNSVREKRKLPLEVKKPSKRKALLSSEEENALNKVLALLKKT